MTFMIPTSIYRPCLAMVISAGFHDRSETEKERQRKRERVIRVSDDRSRDKW